MQDQPRSTSYRLESEEARNRLHPCRPRESESECGLSTPRCQPSGNDFGLLACRTVSEQISVAGSHQVCDNLLQQPQDTNAVTLLHTLGSCPSCHPDGFSAGFPGELLAFPVLCPLSIHTHLCLLHSNYRVYTAALFVLFASF